MRDDMYSIFVPNEYFWEIGNDKLEEIVAQHENDPDGALDMMKRYYDLKAFL